MQLGRTPSCRPSEITAGQDCLSDFIPNASHMLRGTPLKPMSLCIIITIKSGGQSIDRKSAFSQETSSGRHTTGVQNFSSALSAVVPKRLF